MAMRDDARRLVEDLPDDDLPIVVHMLKSFKFRRQQPRIVDAGYRESEEALGRLTELSQEFGQYNVNQFPEDRRLP